MKTQQVMVAASLFHDIYDIVRDEAEQTEEASKVQLLEALEQGEWVKRGRGASCAALMTEGALEEFVYLASYRADYWGYMDGDKNYAAMSAAQRVVQKFG